tara:strand:+ start:312 stop:2675 length:2364 start_codon:yes stop_codon:yes gene_type:complete
MSSKQCAEKPYFVIVKKTDTGFSFDNTVTYNSPLASHSLSQAKGVLHPALQVTSDWGIKNKSGTITQLLTGQAGANALKSSSANRNVILSKIKTIRKKDKPDKKVLVSRFGLLAPSAGSGGGYTLSRVGDRAEGLAVSELANLLSDLSNRPNSIKVRGSPLEYKRLLDYIQFLMVEKVNNNKKLYLARPNNYRVMDAVYTDGISLEDAYTGMTETDSTMYNTAYFATGDRTAALASVVRGIPTLYTTGTGDYYNVPITNVIPRIRKILADMLTDKGFTMPKTSMKNHNNRTQELVTPGGRPVITSSPLFAWFLDTRNVGTKTTRKTKETRTVGTDFHGLKVELRALIIFYWVFNYPTSTGAGVNEQVAKYFLAILDTFHDFTDHRATNRFKNIWPESKNPRPHENAKSKTRNGITDSNVPSSSEQHKFLVKLLGIDIYRKVNAYNNSIKNTITKTNGRTQIAIGLRVAHFLYFITNVLGSQSSRGLIGACEELSRDIMENMADNTPINRGRNIFKAPNRVEGENICKLLEEKKACVVYDMGSLPTCMKKYTVFHNVGVLDPAADGVLSWGEVVGEDGCVESAKVKAAKTKQRKEREAAKKVSKSRAERTEKAKQTRIQRKANEVTAAKRKANLNVIKTKQASNRRATLALKRGIVGNNKPVNKPVNNVRPNKPVNKPVNNARPNLTTNFSKLGNMKMNISKGAPRPKMESFNLFLISNTVTNDTVKGLLNKITFNQSRFNGKNKQIVRNVLNKIIRRNNQPQNLNSVARNLKAKMFANNVRQLRNRP